MGEAGSDGLGCAAGQIAKSVEGVDRSWLISDRRTPRLSSGCCWNGPAALTLTGQGQFDLGLEPAPRRTRLPSSVKNEGLFAEPAEFVEQAHVRRAGRLAGCCSTCSCRSVPVVC